MSALNGDRARYHKERQRKLQRRRQLQALIAKQLKRKVETAAAPGA